VAAVALTVVVVAVAVAVLSTVVASATSPARRSLSTKRIAIRILSKIVRKCEYTKKAFVGFCLDY
jgi:predicted lysophospholipase L1 biosynthesis ABC-type transport system permease subunit